MRQTQITFLMLAAIGGCTPIAAEQRMSDDPSFQPQAQMAGMRPPVTPPPSSPRWSGPELPMPAGMEQQQQVVTATTGPNGSVSTSITVGKQPTIVAQLPTPLQNTPPAVPPPLIEVDHYLEKANKPAPSIVQTNFTPEIKPEPAGSGFVEAKNAPTVLANTPPAITTVLPGSLPATIVTPSVLPLAAPVSGPPLVVSSGPPAVTPSGPPALTPSVVAPTNNVVDLGVTPLSQPAFKMVNSKKFTLNFEVKDVGVTGISTVDLWCTQDMKTWKKFESAQQLANALVVEVKEEGTYGFTLLARNGNGLGKTPPQTGEPPQVWVSVDMTPPTVSLAGVEMSLTSKKPSLIVRWTAKDRNFGPKPVTLSFATTLEGPWTLMAANVENNGRYEWPLPAAMPNQMFVRVQAADQNGNIGFAQTDNPIRLDTYSPKPEPVAVVPAVPAMDPARPSTLILGVEPSQP